MNNRLSKSTDLSLDPTQRLQLFQQKVRFRQPGRQLDGIVASTLRNPDDSLDLLDPLVIRRRRPVEVSGNLGTQVGIDDERLQDVLGHDVGQATSVVLDIVVADVNVIDTERQVGRRDGSDSPVRLGAKGLLLVVGRRDGLDLISVAVRA